MGCLSKGFTAWSAQRSPEEVFTLLENVYQEFDALARRRGVFKVCWPGSSGSGLQFSLLILLLSIAPLFKVETVSTSVHVPCASLFQFLSHVTKKNTQIGDCYLAVTGLPGRSHRSWQADRQIDPDDSILTAFHLSVQSLKMPMHTSWHASLEVACSRWLRSWRDCRAR